MTEDERVLVGVFRPTTRIAFSRSEQPAGEPVRSLNGLAENLHSEEFGCSRVSTPLPRDSKRAMTRTRAPRAGRDKPLSLHPLTLEQALKGAMATGAPPPGPKRKREGEEEPPQKRGRKPKGTPEAARAASSAPASPAPSDQSGRKTHTKRRLLTPKGE